MLRDGQVCGSVAAQWRSSRPDPAPSSLPYFKPTCAASPAPFRTAWPAAAPWRARGCAPGCAPPAKRVKRSHQALMGPRAADGGERWERGSRAAKQCQVRVLGRVTRGTTEWMLVKTGRTCSGRWASGAGQQLPPKLHTLPVASPDQLSPDPLSLDPRTWQKMRRPVGLWNRSTAVSTLFTFWPPAPLARAVLSSMSCREEGKRKGGRGGGVMSGRFGAGSLGRW